MKRLTAMAAALVLSACGGGGGDGTTTTTPPATSAVSAEGFWTGTSSKGAQVQVAVLEDGTAWGFYTVSGALAGALYGSSSSVVGTTLSGSGLDIYGGAIHPVTFTGTVATKSTLNVTLSSGSTFAGRYSTAYDQAALLSSLAGTYAGWGLTGATAARSVPVTISAGGAISATDAGCAISGTATPRATGKNIFNIQATFTGSTCTLGNGTVTSGIAFYDTATRQLIVMAMNSSKTDGFMYAGVR